MGNRFPRNQTAWAQQRELQRIKNQKYERPKRESEQLDSTQSGLQALRDRYFEARNITDGHLQSLKLVSQRYAPNSFFARMHPEHPKSFAKARKMLMRMLESRMTLRTARKRGYKVKDGFIIQWDKENKMWVKRGDSRFRDAADEELYLAFKERDRVARLLFEKSPFSFKGIRYGFYNGKGVYSWTPERWEGEPLTKSPEEKAVEKQDKEIARKACLKTCRELKLTPKQKEAIFLKLVESMSIVEIAEKLKIKPSSVSDRLAGISKKLDKVEKIKPPQEEIPTEDEKVYQLYHWIQREIIRL